MRDIRWQGDVPVFWSQSQAPSVDEARVNCCIRCSCPSRVGGKIWIYGHGVRQRVVVVTPSLKGGRPVLGECWVRRYRCQRCRAVMSVHPRGVLPRYLYSLLSIVMALFAVEARPLGEGLNHAQAYDHQGMNPVRCWRRSGPYRWRSLARWAGKLPDWWPFARTPKALLVTLLARVGCRHPERLMKAVLSSHVSWGALM